MGTLKSHLYPLALGAALASFALPAFVCLPPQARGAEASVPPAVAGLLPKSAVLKNGDWGVFDTEFGKSFTGDMLAEFPGRTMSCDSTVGPELRVELKGDTAWEASPMLEMAVQIHESDIAGARKSLPERVASLKKSNSDIKSVGKLTEVKLPAGNLLFIEYTENCGSHPQGTNTVLLGFARKGATQLSFDLWMSAGATETKALGIEILDKFQKFNPAPLLGK